MVASLAVALGELRAALAEAERDLQATHARIDAHGRLIARLRERIEALEEARPRPTRATTEIERWPQE